MWLLALCLFFGPAGVGTSTALAAAMPEACDPGCCDEVAQAHEAHEAEAHDDCEDACEGDCEDDPCEDACPEGCHECSCCFSVAVELDCVPQVGPARASAVLSTPEPHSRPASGTSGSVFRPPRSLS